MRWIRDVFGVLCLIALGACGGKEAIPEPEAIYIDGMRNSWLVGDQVMGGQPSPTLLAQMAEQGFRTVISLRTDKEMSWDEKAEVEGLGMTFVSIPMPLPLSKITNEQVDSFAHVMKYAERPMLLHCSEGDRIAALWGVWLAEVEDIDSDEAVRLAAAAGMTRTQPQVLNRLEQSRLLEGRKSLDSF